MKKVHIIGGGTLVYVRSHLALSAPAYGGTARAIERFCQSQENSMDVHLHLTRMAGGKKNAERPYGLATPWGLETTADVSLLVDCLITDPATKIIFMPVAMCDFSGTVGDPKDIGRFGPRIDSHAPNRQEMAILLKPYPKVISRIRQQRVIPRDASLAHDPLAHDGLSSQPVVRKDIFLVGWKMTTGATPDQQYLAGLRLCKEASCNLVFANDTVTKLNMVVTPEEARYHVTEDKERALEGLVQMAYLRSHLTFTRSTVVEGDPVPWKSALVPLSLRTVVDHCIKRGAYKPFQDKTAGHFAVKIDDETFLTSRRKTNFNQLEEIGLVRVVTDGPDSVIAYGSKPSVGGQSQRIVFHDHQDYDCIVHFHCPIKKGSEVPTISQREYECGSHQCGQNTSKGLKRFGNLSAVYLDQHGPNVVFHRSIDPQEVVNFIEANFDLELKTGGPVA
jgi:hypothetical protein